MRIALNARELTGVFEPNTSRNAWISCPPSMKVSLEPGFREMRDLIQRSGFLEQMRGARDDLQLLSSLQPRKRLLVQPNDDLVESTDHQQRRRANLLEELFGQIRPTASRHHGVHDRRPFRGSNQRGGRPCTRSEEPGWQRRCEWVRVCPVDRANQTIGEQWNVESKFGCGSIDAIFVDSEEIQQKCSHAAMVEHIGDRAIARAVSAAAAPMRENHESARIIWDSEITVDGDARQIELNRSRRDGFG
jgi:hypothetical protein